MAKVVRYINNSASPITSGIITIPVGGEYMTNTDVPDFDKLDEILITKMVDGKEARTQTGWNSYHPTISASSGDGIKIDPVVPTFGWRDITAEILTRGVGATDPDWAQIGSGPFYAYKFALDDVCWMNYHIPHDYLPGSDIYVHVHWIPSGTNTAVVKWSLAYTFARGHNQANFSAAGDSTNIEQAPPGSAYRHMISESTAITIPTLEVDGLLYVKLARVTNGGTDNTDDIFVLTADVHYQSTNIGTKNKAPGFYT
jgi:hypothetical protein